MNQCAKISISVLCLAVTHQVSQAAIGGIFGGTPPALTQNIRFINAAQAGQLSNIVAALPYGTTAALGPGLFDIASNSVVLPPGVNLIGQGIDVTEIRSTAALAVHGTIIQFRSTNVLQNLTITCGGGTNYTQAGAGTAVTSGNPACTNVTIRNVKVNGFTDAILFSHTANCSGLIEGCEAISRWDNVLLTEQNDGDGIGGFRFTVRRCKIISDRNPPEGPGTATFAYAVRLQNGYFDIVDCEIIATNAQTVRGINFSGNDTNYLVLDRTSIRVAGTNSVWAIDDVTDSFDQVCGIVALDCSIDPTQVNPGTTVAWITSVANQNYKTVNVPTNSPQSNLVVNFDVPLTVYYCTNNWTITNFVGLTNAYHKKTTLKFVPQLINRGMGTPTFGAPSYGIRFYTNSTGPMIVSGMTPGTNYVLELDAMGTNVEAKMSLSF